MGFNLAFKGINSHSLYRYVTTLTLKSKKGACGASVPIRSWSSWFESLVGHQPQGLRFPRFHSVPIHTQAHTHTHTHTHIQGQYLEYATNDYFQTLSYPSFFNYRTILRYTFTHIISWKNKHILWNIKILCVIKTVRHLSPSEVRWIQFNIPYLISSISTVLLPLIYAYGPRNFSRLILLTYLLSLLPHSASMPMSLSYK
jgi:hypothetical protein